MELGKKLQSNGIRVYIVCKDSSHTDNCIHQLDLASTVAINIAHDTLIT